MYKIPVPWRNTAEAILYISLILFVIGAVNVFSASFILALKQSGDSYIFLKKQLLSFVVGLIVLVMAMKFDYRRIGRLSLLLAIGVIGLLIAVFFVGVSVNGARRWLWGFQPSELAKVTAIFITAAYLGPKIDRQRMVSLLSWPFFLTVLMGGLVLKQPDMGTASVIVGMSILLYIIAGIPRQEMMGLAMLGGMGVIYLVYAAAYRAERIGAWLNPWAFQQTTGYQTVQSLLAIGSGGLFGTGLGMGASKFYYLPEAHTDFAFAVLCQEMGFIGAVIVLLLFGLLGWYGIKVALAAPDGVGKMLAVGLTALVVGQAIGNIAMVSGLLPVTGIPLPFISYGGTSLIVNMAAVGVLSGVARRSASYKPEEPAKLHSQRRFKLVSR